MYFFFIQASSPEFWSSVGLRFQYFWKSSPGDSNMKPELGKTGPPNKDRI